MKILSFFVLTALFACPTIPAQKSSATKLAAGIWGGQHIRMNVTASGAELELDCAHGQITQPIALDANGAFDVAGTFASEHGGPVRPNENDKPQSNGRYSGKLEGDTLTLSIKTVQSDIGSFTLTRGQDGRLMKCR